MADAQVVQLLKALQSTTNQERQQAEALYKDAKVNNPEQTIVSFVGVIANAGAEEAVRKYAAILLRQLVNSHAGDKEFAFGKLSPDKKTAVAQELLKLFEAEANAGLQKKVGEVLAKLAEGAFEDDPRGWLNGGAKGWPQLMEMSFRMANPAVNQNATSCESAIRLLKELVPTLRSEIVQAQQQLGVVLQNSFQHADVKVKCAAVLLVCEIVGVVDKKSYAPLMATVNVMNQVLQQMAQAKMWSELEECLTAYTEVAAEEPDFFKASLQQNMEPAKLFGLVCQTKDDTLEEGLRTLALEWLVTYVEKKPKWLVKSVPALPALAMECCMAMMLEVEGDESQLKEWMERMDDEEGEEDADEVFHSGEESIDRVVQALTMEYCAQPLFAVVGKNVALDAWQARHAALAALKQTVEYIEETEHMNQCAQLLINHVDHPHPRVRYMSLHAIGQLANDQAPHFQEGWHSTLMPHLLRKMDDQIDRVASMAMSAFVSFGSEMDGTLMLDYSHRFMEKLVSRLQSSKHRMVQEESITSIAVIAGCIDKDFSQYYDGMMPLLKQFVLTALDPKQGRLRGKAFECMSLLGLAVGKEKFLPDAREALEAMFLKQVEADDLQKEYIKEASERICKCLKADFAPFLQGMLPNTLAGLKIDGEEATGQAGDDDDDYVTVSTGDGKLKKVRTAKFEEMVQAVQLLHTFATEMEGAYFDCIPQTAEALVPLLGNDEIAMLCDEARGAAYACWAELIKCGIKGAKDRGQQPAIARQLLSTFLQKVFAIFEQEPDPDTVAQAAEGIHQCLKNTDQGMLSSEEILQIVQKLFVLIEESMKRTALIKNAKQAGAAGAPAELQGDDDEDDDGEDDEETCRRACEEALGSCMKVDPTNFVKCLPDVSGKLQQWFATKENKVLGLFLACDLLEHLKDQSQSIWPVFMPVIFQSLTDSDPEVRIPAAYAVNLASPIPAFAEAAPQAFRGLAQIIGAPAPKKRDEKAKVALDNAVAALLALAKEKSQQCPPEIQAFQMVAAKLPLKEDEEEAKKVHKIVVEMLLAQHAGLIGPNAANLGKILSALAEVYKSESLSEKETDDKILMLFKGLERTQLLQMAASFTEKQQKKIEKMLSA